MNKREKQELLRLKRENARLRRENEYLNHRIEKLSPKEAKNVSPERELFYELDDVDEYNGYFGYLISRFKLSLVYRVYDKIFFAFRKIILASRIWKYAPIVLGALAAVLQAVLAFGSAVVLLPLAFTVSAVFFLLSLFAFAKHRRELLRDVRGRKIYFMYPSKKPRKDGIFYETMQQFSRDGVVFAVSPSLPLCGFGGVRKVSENVYFIHTSFYYKFKEEAYKICTDIVKVY
ncbi:MAG: hypothetical protein IJX27_02660 [Clostridia bacterium]|nr:hypothetical protein [Clostridia bacterium]